jgi:hypothetical protein
MIESDLEKYLITESNKRGFLCLKLRIDGTNGWPDRTLFSKHGMVAFIELKRPKRGRPSSLQRKWIAELVERGRIAEFIESKDALDRILDMLDTFDRLSRELDDEQEGEGYFEF